MPLPSERFREGGRHWPPGPTDSKGTEIMGLSPDRLHSKREGIGVGVGHLGGKKRADPLKFGV